MTLVVGNPSEAPVAQPAANGTVSLPALPPGADVSAEYMAAVAISLQKTKELEEAQHQAAI